MDSTSPMSSSCGRGQGHRLPDLQQASVRLEDAPWAEDEGMRRGKRIRGGAVADYEGGRHGQRVRGCIHKVRSILV